MNMIEQTILFRGVKLDIKYSYEKAEDGIREDGVLISPIIHAYLHIHEVRMFGTNHEVTELFCGGDIRDELIDTVLEVLG